MFLLGEKSIHLAQIVIIYVLTMINKAQGTGTWNGFLFMFYCKFIPDGIFLVNCNLES